MRRSLIISAAAVALAMTFPAAAGAVPRQIDVDDDFFAPRNPPTRNFEPGPSFRWSNGGGTSNEHNVRQDDRLFSSGGLTDGPINFAIRASAGSFHYYCTLHQAQGMSGRVKVRPIAVPDSLVGRDRGPLGELQHQHGLAVRRPLPGGPAEVEDLEERHVRFQWVLRPQRQPGQLQAEPPQLQDQGALGASPGQQAQRLVAGPVSLRLSRRLAVLPPPSRRRQPFDRSAGGPERSPARTQ